MIGADLREPRHHPHGGVHAGGDALAQQVASRPLRRRDQFLDRGRGRGVPQQVLRVLRQQPRQPSVRPLDHAAFGRGRVHRHARHLERQRIAQRHVPAGADQDHRPVGHGLVQLAAVRMAADIELHLIVAARHDPAALGRLRRPLAQRRLQRLERRRGGGARIHPIHRDPERHQVQVIVVEARRGEPALEVDHLRLRPAQRQHLRIRPGRQDAALPRRQRLADFVVVSAPDPTVRQNRVGLDGRLWHRRGSLASLTLA